MEHVLVNKCSTISELVMIKMSLQYGEHILSNKDLIQSYLDTINICSFVFCYVRTDHIHKVVLRENNYSCVTTTL